MDSALPHALLGREERDRPEERQETAATRSKKPAGKGLDVDS